ncbi:MAG: hypothetical protein ABH952_07790 [Candidatus Omnitrophota bacterium]
MRKWVMFLVLVALIVQLGGCARPQRGVHVEGKEGEEVDVQW